jgi:hypothetical protein
MPYAFVQDVPADERMYAEICARLGDAAPKGLVVHLALPNEGGGLRYVDVWDTREDWERFRDEQVEPVVSDVLAGHTLPHDHSLVRFEEVRVVDVWLGAPVDAPVSR